jgi:hypothetical protein
MHSEEGQQQSHPKHPDDLKDFCRPEGLATAAI